MVTGTITDVQRFSIHDGPGIRTTVFFKGCPLDCVWCQNPEAIDPAPQLGWRKARCIKCGSCAKVCPEKAINGTPARFKQERCKERVKVGCRACTDACPSGALEIAGKTVTVNELLTAVLQDKAYYDESGGGVTVSGGEPTYQWPFVKAFLAACKANGIATAIETCGFFGPGISGELVDVCDVILFDLKHLDLAKHRALTGQPNDTILANLKRVQGLVKDSEAGKRFSVRMPLVPGLNDAKDHLLAVEAFLAGIGITNLVLLPYHSLYTQKIDDFFMSREKLKTKSHTKEELDGIAQLFTHVSVSFGG